MKPRWGPYVAFLGWAVLFTFGVIRSPRPMKMVGPALSASVIGAAFGFAAGYLDLILIRRSQTRGGTRAQLARRRRRIPYGVHTFVLVAVTFAGVSMRRRPAVGGPLFLAFLFVLFCVGLWGYHLRPGDERAETRAEAPLRSEDR